MRIIYPGDVVHASGDEEHAVRGPGEIIYLRARRPAHGPFSPCFLVLGVVLSECRTGIICRYPEDDCAVVSC